MHTFGSNAGALNQQGTVFFAGAQCEISTNDGALLRMLAQSAAPAMRAPSGLPAFTMQLVVHHGSAPLNAVPHFRGQQHIAIARFGAETVFVFDLFRRHVHGAVNQLVARDAGFWTEKLLPIAVGVMSACIGVLPVHAACFSFDGEGILIAGASGAGKSTLSAALCMHGVEYLADDWTYITQDAGELLAHGVAAPIKLLPDAVHHFPVLAMKELEISMNGELAFAVHPAEELQAKIIRKCKPGRLLFLERRPQPGISFTPVTPEFARNYLDRNVERLPSKIGDAPLRRARLMNAVAALPAWKVSYGGSPSFAAAHLRQFMHDLCPVSA